MTTLRYHTELSVVNSRASLVGAHKQYTHKAKQVLLCFCNCWYFHL